MNRRILRPLAIGAGFASLFLIAHLSFAHKRITTDVTWAEHVRPIFREKCMQCHHPGGMAPKYVDLTTYGVRDGVTGAGDWYKSIEDMILTDRMPPWPADPRYGHFSNIRKLTKDETDIIISWTQGGAPQGTPLNLPAPEEYQNTTWSLGEPDLAVEMPQEQTIPAGTRDGFARVVVPIEIDEDKWVTGYEFMPGDASVVHTIIALVHDPEGAPLEIEMEEKLPYDPLADEDDLEKIVLRPLQHGVRFLGQWTRGDRPVLLPDEAGRKLRKGSKIELQVFYRKQGIEDRDREFKDHSKLGLYFGIEPAHLLMESQRIANDNFTIPAGAKSHKVTAERTLEEDIRLVSIHPQVGYLAKELEILAHFPDGRPATLVYIPEYDQKWNASFIFEEPITAPKGTKIELVAHFDNTESNDYLPTSTPKEMRAGPDQPHARLSAYIDYYLENHIFVPTPTPTPRPPQEGGGMTVFTPIPDDSLPTEPSKSPLSAQNITKKAVGEGALPSADKPQDLFVTTPKPETQTAEGEIYWCPMRGNPCAVVDHSGPGKCPDCGMNLRLKSELLKRWEGQLAPKNADWKLSKEGGQEIYWCAFRGRPDHELKDYTARGKCEVCGVELVHKSRFERVRSYVDLKTGEIFYGPGLNPATMEPVQSMGHMDHNPVHGGLFFMADNLYHHVEGTLHEPGKLQVFFYDDFKQPLDPRNFKGRAVIERYDEEKDEVIEEEFELVHAYELNPYLEAEIPEVTEFPFEINAFVWLAGEETLFTFRFPELTKEPDPEAAIAGDVYLHSHDDYKPPQIPDKTEDIIAEILKREAQLKERIAAKDLLAIHYPAMDTRHFVDELRLRDEGLSPRNKAKLRDASIELQTACDELDRAGDARDEGRVGVRFKLYTSALQKLLEVFPQAK